MRAVDWIAVLGVAAALVLGLAGVLGIMVVAGGHTRNERLHLLRTERRQAYVALLAAKARLDQLIPECNAARIAELEGRPLTELEQQARRELVPSYRRFGECVQVATAFADPATAKTLTPLYTAVTEWINASQQDRPDADRAEAWTVYLRGTAFVQALREELGLPDLQGVEEYADSWSETGHGRRPDPAPPVRQRQPQGKAQGQAQTPPEGAAADQVRMS